MPVRTLAQTGIIILLTLASFSLVTYTACTRDNCKIISCLNGSICRDGACICNDAYTGSRCETKLINDPCAGISCQHGGTCDGGICTCPYSYEGMYCQDKIRDKFIGSWLNVNSSTIMTITSAASDWTIDVHNSDIYGAYFSASVSGTNEMSFSHSDPEVNMSGIMRLLPNDSIEVENTVNDGAGPYHEGGKYVKR